MQWAFSSTKATAGTTVAIVHFGFQDPSRGPLEDIAMEIQTLEDMAPDAYYAGLTATEIGQLLFIGDYAVTGGAGAVAPNAAVTITNTTAGGTATVNAHSDGSFGAPFPGVTPGDMVQITTDLGRDETITAM